MQFPRSTRRKLLTGALAVPLLGRGLAAGAMPAASPDTSGANDDPFWLSIAAQYDVTNEVIQVENGNWGMMPRPVLDAYHTHLGRVNRDTSFYTRRGFGRDAMAVREQFAAALGVPPEEVAFTRNATEALKALILGYNRLTPGDAVLYADLDYDSMQACMQSLARRRGAQVVRIDLPEPASHENLIAAYAQAFEDNPRLRLLLLTRMSHRTGLVIPVREIAALAKARGIDVIVDAAHSWFQCDEEIASLDCDFVGVNGHKWLGAPLGVGAIHIRKAALGRIDPDPAETSDRSVFNRVHTGTSDMAAILTVPDALAFHARIGGAKRIARLRTLRDRWVEQVLPDERIEVLTPQDHRLHGAITSLRLRGRTSSEDNRALAQLLLDRHGIFTVHRDGVAKGSCLRITPALFNTMDQMDRVAGALREAAGALAG